MFQLSGKPWLRLILNLLCVGCSVLCPSVEVHVFFGAADNSCSSPSKAIRASHVTGLTHCTAGHTLRLQGDPTSSGIRGHIPWHHPGILETLWAETHPAAELSPSVACTGAMSPMALACSTVLCCESNISKGRLC